jgi:hypothetical protein
MTRTECFSWLNYQFGGIHDNTLNPLVQYTIRMRVSLWKLRFETTDQRDTKYCQCSFVGSIL